MRQIFEKEIIDILMSVALIIKHAIIHIHKILITYMCPKTIFHVKLSIPQSIF